MDYEYIEGLMQDDQDDRFAVTDDRKADWALEQVLEFIAERDRITSIADAKIKELQAQKQALAEKCQTATGYLTGLLHVYFRLVNPSTATKTQSTYKLLSGKLVLKHQQPEYQRDEQALLAWANTNYPDFVQVKESVNWADLKKATSIVGEDVFLTETGEFIPGVVAKARDDVFEVAKA